MQAHLCAWPEIRVECISKVSVSAILRPKVSTILMQSAKGRHTVGDIENVTGKIVDDWSKVGRLHDIHERIHDPDRAHWLETHVLGCFRDLNPSPPSSPPQAKCESSTQSPMQNGAAAMTLATMPPAVSNGARKEAAKLCVDIDEVVRAKLLQDPNAKFIGVPDVRLFAPPEIKEKNQGQWAMEEKRKRDAEDEAEAQEKHRALYVKWKAAASRAEAELRAQESELEEGRSTLMRLRSNGIVCSLAPNTNIAGCKTCGREIKQGALRVAKSTLGSKSTLLEGSRTYHHVECYVECRGRPSKYYSAMEAALLNELVAQRKKPKRQATSSHTAAKEAQEPGSSVMGEDGILYDIDDEFS